MGTAHRRRQRRQPVVVSSPCTCSVIELQNFARRKKLIIVGLGRDSFVNEILPHIDCVILGPGPGTPHRDSDFSWPTRLIAEFGDRLPIFGLCLGLQGLATTFGGKVRLRSAPSGAEQVPIVVKRAERFLSPLQVIKAAAPKHGQISRIRLDRTSTTYLDLFEGVRDEFDAVQYNSLMVDAASLPRDLEVTAWTDSAVAGREPEAMALQHHVKPLYGVQFHPEVRSHRVSFVSRDTSGSTS
jgi:para-aminobenzoate synthetase